MIYYIFYELIFNHSSQDWWLVKALNVFQYVTFRTAYASVTALLISLLFGRRLIKGLKKWNIGQQIREEGRIAGDSFSNNLGSVMGETVELLCLGRDPGDTGVRRSRVCRRLSQAGE